MHSGTAQNTTFEAWLKQDQFKAQVVLPFKEYLKAAFREWCYLRIQYHYLLFIADDNVARKVMARAQVVSDADTGTALLSSAQGSGSANGNKTSSQSAAGRCHGGTCPESLPPSDLTNEVDVENTTGTDVIGKQKAPTWSWSPDLKSHNRRRHDPKDDDNADYTAENEEDDVETGFPVTSRTKSARISKQSKKAELTRKET